jgi:two-component system chemotaxis sensor kinase CheA
MIEAHHYAHEVEGFITDIKNTPEAQKGPKYEELIGMFDKMEEIFENFVNSNKKIIGVKSWDNFDKGLEVPVNNLQYFYDKMKKHNVHDELLDDFIDRIYSEPASKFLAQYVDLADEVALKLGKEIYQMEIIGGDVRLNGKIYDELFSSLVHAVRNAIDHGIESPSKREEAGKDRKGKITFTISRENADDGELLQIVMQDDGGGINPEIIRKKMIENGFEDVVKDMNEKEVIQQIFSAGFSTNEAVTDISGRGVGMDAIMNVCKDLGGTVWAESEVGKGTKFIIQVPYKRS